MEISINDINTSNAILIDIRENYEYKIGHFKDAINIPYDILKLVPEKYLNKNSKYYLYCDKGIYSNELVNYLYKLGYNVYSIDGGFDKYTS